MEWNRIEESQLDEVASEVLSAIGKKRILLFEGDLGTGKTTMIKELCKQLKVAELVNSPTYSIVNEYKFGSDKTIYHFDLYRLEQEELYELGFEEYLSSGDYVFIEWPKIALEFIPEDSLILRISEDTVGRKYMLTSINN